MLNPLQICDGLWAQSSPSGADGCRDMFYEELFPPMEQSKAWSHRLPDIGVTLEDFSFLASSDLQVFVEEETHPQHCQKLHFRTISTNEPHPLAALPFLEISVPHIDNILLYENHVAVIGGRIQETPTLVVVTPTLVSVWDWTLGRLEMVRHGQKSLISSVN